MHSVGHLPATYSDDINKVTGIDGMQKTEDAGYCDSAGERHIFYDKLRCLNKIISKYADYKSTGT